MGYVSYVEGGNGLNGLITKIWVFLLALSIGAARPVTALAEDVDSCGTDTYSTEAYSAETYNPETYGPGSYIVGKDMPPGEYGVLTDQALPEGAYSTCTITLYKDDTDEKRIGSFKFQHHGLITLYRGQHLVIHKGYAVDADHAGITLGNTGMYKAGRDMEPGIYRLTPLTAGGAYYALYNDVRYYYDYIDDYRMIYEPVVITVEEGQYLELFDVGAVERLDV